MSKFHVIIPARFASTRLPGKPLLEILGKPMLQYVVEAAGESGALSVTIATDDESILQSAEAFGANAVMTSKDHVSGSDRIAEACEILGLADDAIVVNVQGDEPQMPSVVIDQVASLLTKHPLASMATLCTAILTQEQFLKPGVVKVVRSESAEATYFSRAPIPWKRGEGTAGLASDAYQTALRHLGIYAYSSGYIRSFRNRRQTPIEQLEQLEQLRCLWYGDIIACDIAVEVPPAGIDDQQDLERVRAVMAGS